MRKLLLSLALIVALLLGYRYWPRSIAISRSTVASQEFGTIQIFRPELPVYAAILFVEPQFEKSEQYHETLRTLANRGVIAFVVDVDTYLQSLQDDKDCNFIGGAIERLGQSLQNTLGLASYYPPFLIGVGRGAAIAYIARFHSPNRFPGSLALGFCPRISSRISVCETDQLQIERAGLDAYVHYNPSAKLPDSVKQGFVISLAPQTACQFDPTLPTIFSGAEQLEDGESLSSALEQLISTISSDRPGGGKLPLVELESPSAKPPYLAVFLSGDGGWAGIDEDTGDYLHKQGLAVIGVSSLRYFWKKKSPQKTAADIQRVFEEYSNKWGIERFILLGYSLGADAAPIIYNRLNEQTKSRIVRVAMLNPEHSTDLQVHISDWLGVSGNQGGIALKPEIEQIPAQKVLCITGKDDDPGVCQNLDRRKFQVVELPGGHHFGGDYQKLGKAVLEGLIP